MTPLAHKIVNELTLPVKRRAFADEGFLLARMSDIHCFECSSVYEMALDLIWPKGLAHGSIEALTGVHEAAFLPAPKTWIELNHRSRLGFLLEDHGGECFSVTMAEFGAGGFFRSFSTGCLFAYARTVRFGTSVPIRYTSPTNMDRIDKEDETDQDRELIHNAAICYGFLPIINAPRIIGRRQHMPHAGLEKRLLRSGAPGKYPLHAWTEILLEVHPPVVDGEEHEAHLTGKRALHFCRAHLRIKNGRLERVRSHWRGDPAIGIKQSRYRVVP